MDGKSAVTRKEMSGGTHSIQANVYSAQKEEKKMHNIELYIIEMRINYLVLPRIPIFSIPHHTFKGSTYNIIEHRPRAYIMAN